MIPEQYRRVGELYHSALELAPAARADFLAEACGGDDELRREVESLLQAHGQADGFIAGQMAGAVAELTTHAQASSLVGQSIGHYQVLSLLGAGGMGEVWLAEDTSLGRKAALKLLPPAFIRDQERLRRFEREARTASALNHPNILTIYEIGVAGEMRFIATEYIDGQTLRERLRDGRPELNESLDIALQIASALSAAHEAGIIHRDIKPENVMVRRDRLIKVLDFGLAKLNEASALPVDPSASTLERLSTAPGVVMGTVSYMSPEQARGQKVDHRTDIFSLGVMLYEMLAGRRPFEGATTGDVFAALLRAEPPPLREHCAEATAELEQIISKCLAKEREARWQSAEELSAALQALRSGAQAAVSRRVEDSRARFAAWRWPVVAAIAAVLIVALVWFLSWRRAPVVQPNQIKSLAVLPLENLSGDAAQEYFADGMTEALISNLSQVRALQVISRTSVMRFKGASKPLAEIARELNVDAVIEGSVQRDGGRVKITARLIQAANESLLRSFAYERELADVLKLQGEVARAVADEIRIQVTAEERARLAAARPIKPAAYDEYLRGRFYANRQNKADNETAIQTLERAVALDPTYAAAHAELAQAYVWRLHLFAPHEKQWEEKAFMSVQKAFSLDSDSPVAHLARGRMLWTSANHFPHEEAIREYRRALALNPNLDEARNQLALVYNHIGAFDLALQELQKAVTDNPANNLAQFRIGETLAFEGKYEQALTALRKSPKEANPVLLTSFQAMALLHLGRNDEAATLVEQFLQDHPGDANVGLFTGIQALLAALRGQAQQAEEKISNAIARGKGFGHFHHTAYNIACAYAVMKKTDPALKWLQAAADDGFPCYPLFERDPYLDHLRKEPRFIALMAKLKEQWQSYLAKL